MATLELIHHNKELGPVALSEVTIQDEIAEGSPELFLLKNAGPSMVREIIVDLDGEGADHVQLAVDEEGEPGVWAAPGEGIVAFVGGLHPDESAPFWARGFYSPEDLEGALEFEFLVRTISA